MKSWTKAFLVACVLELPLLTLLVAQASQDLSNSHLAKILLWYHVIPLSGLSWIFLVLFGHGSPTVGSPLLWRVLLWSSVFAVQVALTMPFVRLALELFHHPMRSDSSSK